MSLLDRPIWNALSTKQARFAAGGAHALRYVDDVSPLSALADHSSQACAAMAALIAPGDNVSLVEAKAPPPPDSVEETLCAPLLQMAAPNMQTAAATSDMQTLGDADAADMLALALLTKPGPFRARTHQLGRFIGVRDKGRLIAMAGERLHLEGFREISAVCTLPEFRGRGLGAALMRAVGARILADGEIPFLHCYPTNASAVALYERLGFSVRAELLHVAWRAK
jgi:ribosomal protein S18 acetylase RimI-like enzyme